MRAAKSGTCIQNDKRKSKHLPRFPDGDNTQIYINSDTGLGKTITCPACLNERQLIVNTCADRTARKDTMH